MVNVKVTGDQAMQALLIVEGDVAAQGLSKLVVVGDAKLRSSSAGA